MTFTIGAVSVILIVALACAVIVSMFLLGFSLGIHYYKNVLHIPDAEKISQVKTPESRKFHNRD